MGLTLPLFYGLISAVKSLQTKSNFQDVQDTKYVHEPLSTKILEVQNSITLIYKKLINNKRLTPVSSQKKFIEECCLPTNDNINWTTAYVLTKKSTKSTKLIEFQYKFLHRRIPTKNFQCRIGVPANENCSFCHTSTELLIHLFVMRQDITFLE